MAQFSMDTQPAALGAAGGVDPYAEFRVTLEREIAALLRQLVDAALPVALSGPDAVTLTSSLWSCDAAQRRVSFAADADSPQLQQLLETGEATCVAYLDAVKLQFDANNLILVRGAQHCVLQADLPRVMYRFQRRESYRVRTHDRGMPTARLRHPSIPEMQLALRVLDVSIGGCALLQPGDVPPIAAGVELHGVHVELDADTAFDTNLKLHHVTTMHAPSRAARLGCEFMHVAPATERALQRYIDQTQKRRRLLTLG